MVQRLLPPPAALAVPRAPERTARQPYFSETELNRASDGRTSSQTTAPRQTPPPSLAQKVLAGPVGDGLPVVAAGAVLFGAAAITVGGVFAAKAVSDKLEGHKWGGCRIRYNEKYARICDNSNNDFFFPTLAALPEFAATAFIVIKRYSGKTFDAVQNQVNAARLAIDLHNGSAGV